MEARQVEELQETIDRLRVEVAALRASRERLVLAADADRRTIERDLHDGVQQHLVALAVNLQLAGPLVKADSAAATELLEEMQRDVQQALDETTRLSQRIHPMLLDAADLRSALRSAAASTGISASVEVAGGPSYPPELAWTVYLCWLEALEHAAGPARATVTVRADEGALFFEVVTDVARSDAGPSGLRDRVEALGGRLAIQSTPDGETRVSGSLPLSR